MSVIGDPYFACYGEISIFCCICFIGMNPFLILNFSLCSTHLPFFFFNASGFICLLERI
jgi:hypothetical protein